MKAEKGMGIPVFLRTGYAISTRTGKAANTMTEDEWEQFYSALAEQLKRDYPELYGLIFSASEYARGRLCACQLHHGF